MLYSTLSRSQYDFTLPQVSFTSTGYHKHVTLTFNPTVRNTRLPLRLFLLFDWLNVFPFWLQSTTGIILFSYQNSVDQPVSLETGSSHIVHVFLCVLPQRKVPDQDVAQGSYIALPLTLLLLLAAYNHEKVNKLLHTICSKSLSTRLLNFWICSVGIKLTGLWPDHGKSWNLEWHQEERPTSSSFHVL